MSWWWYRCPGQWPLMSRCQGMMEKISSQFVHYRHHSLYYTGQPFSYQQFVSRVCHTISVITRAANDPLAKSSQSRRRPLVAHYHEWQAALRIYANQPVPSRSDLCDCENRWIVCSSSYKVIMLWYVDCYVIDLEPGSCVRIETTHCATPRLASPCRGPDITIIILPWTGATSVL